MKKFSIVSLIIVVVIWIGFVECCGQTTDVKLKFSIIENVSSREISYQLDFFHGDNVIARRTYRAGKLVLSEGDIPDGIVTESYENGNVKSIISYLSGKRNGPFWGFYESGQLKGAGAYRNDIPDGTCKLYYESGNLMAEWEMIDGKEVNRIDYNEDGTLQQSQ